MSQAELLALVLKILGELEIESMLVGSYASSFYGEARTTHDIDLVIDLDPNKIDSLVGSFDPSRYYLSPQALREGRMANLIDTRSGDKIDLFLLGADPDARRQFARRQPTTVLGLKLSIASPEDTIVAKLKWSRDVGGSQRQQSDVREMIRRQKPHLDFDYLRQQLAAYGVGEAFEQILLTLQRESS